LGVPASLLHGGTLHPAWGSHWAAGTVGAGSSSSSPGSPVFVLAQDQHAAMSHRVRSSGSRVPGATGKPGPARAVPSMAAGVVEPGWLPAASPALGRGVAPCGARSPRGLRSRDAGWAQPPRGTEPEWGCPVPGRYISVRLRGWDAPGGRVAPCPGRLPVWPQQMDVQGVWVLLAGACAGSSR